MESYGSYEVTREISSVQGRTVFGAHKSGEAKSDGFVVKLFLASSSPGTDPGGPGEESVAAGARAIELQKQASSASRLVVPVLETGQDERGRWWVSKLYSRSVQKVIAGRVSLSSEDLFHLLHSVVLGSSTFNLLL